MIHGPTLRMRHMLNVVLFPFVDKLQSHMQLTLNFIPHPTATIVLRPVSALCPPLPTNLRLKNLNFLSNMPRNWINYSDYHYFLKSVRHIYWMSVYYGEYNVQGYAGERIWICVDWRARAKNQEEKAFATSGLRGQAGNNLPASCFYYTGRKKVVK